MKILSIPVIALLLFCSCGGKNPGNENQVVAEDSEKVNQLLGEFISKFVPATDTSHAFVLGKDSLHAIALVKEVYGKHSNKPFWSDKGKLNPAGTALYSVITNAMEYGLIPDDYHFKALDSLLGTAYNDEKQSFNITKLGNTDVLMTDAFFTFAVHVSVGRMENDSATSRTWRLGKMKVNPVALFESALASKNYKAAFNSIEPQRPEYQAIKKHMNEHQERYKGAKWNHLPDRKKDSLGFFTGVKTRLKQTGDYDSTSVDSDSLRFSNALKKFQKRYFLEEDGKIGRNTILALDMTPEDWTIQMAMNLERWRWEPATFETRHLLVNLAAFKMTVFEEDTIVMSSRIVCGAIKTQTPELDSKMNQIVLYPYWTVPYSIAWKELLPHIQRDTSYLRKEHYEVLDHTKQIVDPKTVDWKKYHKGYLPFTFRQMTGEENALGIMKFEFNNIYSVYMHDTNSKRYFRYTTRAFSHGCMRLEKYTQLAHFLIRDDSVKLPKDTFDLWAKMDVQRRINLRKPLPIHVRYFTCDINADGNVEVHTDIYLRDERMEKVLYKNHNEQKDAPKKPAAPNSASIKKKSALVRRDLIVGLMC
ncbi:L,D-transpeptidase family protein [soil metagenome]